MNTKPQAKKLQLRLVSTKAEMRPCMIISWNVDGYTDDIHLWLTNFVCTSNPDVVFISETKKPTAHLETKFAEFTNYNVILNVHVPALWHGVAMLIRKDHVYEHIPIQMNIPPRSDTKATEASTGRVIAIHLDQQMYIIGSYTPNSGRGGKHLQYRTETWDPAFMKVLEILRTRAPTMWVGDINVAPDLLDVSNPKAMGSWAGCLVEERNNFWTLMNTKEWIDIWRHQNPVARVYTWCGSPPRPNYGMRLDNVVVSRSLMPRMLNTFMISEGPPLSADHIPVGAYVNLELLSPLQSPPK